MMGELVFRDGRLVDYAKERTTFILHPPERELCKCVVCAGGNVGNPCFYRNDWPHCSEYENTHYCTEHRRGIGAP
jgi:hypothetical protein